MVSILVQERILGAAMGAAFGTGVVLYQQALIYRSTAQAIEFISGKPPVVPPSKVLARLRVHAARFQSQHTSKDLLSKWFRSHYLIKGLVQSLVMLGMLALTKVWVL
uniref:Uncharacterized protein n=1 Tax=Picea sitchensis TaxID=3332 RepID=B8LQI6_PICSI|nr:unknown [Picea sitchensis]